ncbi:hypothetical protein [Sphingomonas sp. 10B4]|uniref:hypothetical protein n=1 Tax=Sphingomonas sp. 10B4 TaxID=3048575 RepID=UPI002AB3663F|nr:hypothetical protein [Sphingomonas sp. 10B4]MDY7522756.1 hypothetical protein [Sphingomonas sp. 10B4]MEB0282653.1 hypothetical protein [Sphingomonas sp. 10B4]
MGRWRPAAGHGTALDMVRSSPPRTPLAGGALIAIGAIAGTGIGLFTPFGPTRGFLIGLGLGVAISLVMWLRDLRR